MTQNAIEELRGKYEAAVKAAEAYDQACLSHPRGGHPARVEAASHMDDAQRDLRRAMGERAGLLLALADAAQQMVAKADARIGAFGMHSFSPDGVSFDGLLRALEPLTTQGTTP